MIHKKKKIVKEKSKRDKKITEFWGNNFHLTSDEVGKVFGLSGSAIRIAKFRNEVRKPMKKFHRVQGNWKWAFLEDLKLFENKPIQFSKGKTLVKIKIFKKNN